MSETEAPKKTGQRKDVQGLRAIAVIAVILTHLLHWPTGGFLGVDIFFVISGYLITGLLLKEHRRTGRISLGNFYRKRVRRIIPLAVLVVIVTIIGTYFMFNVARGVEVFEESLWALFFAANWYFAATGTDYWQADGLTSPLQHYWSLAVEEQFYLLWPWLILAVFAVYARGRLKPGRRPLTGLAWVMGLIMVGSFVFAIWQSVNQPVWAYFSTFSRVWELGAGALLATVPNILGSVSSKIRELIAVAGSAVIIAGFFAIGEDGGVPAPANAVAVIGTVMVIAAGATTELRTVGYLRNPIMQYIGQISYSLYLWHFPVIIVVGGLFSSLNFVNVIVCLCATLVLSVLSFHFIEDPIRRSSWLERSPASNKSLRWKDRAMWRRAAYVGVAAHGVLTLVIVVITVASPLGGRSEAGLLSTPQDSGVQTTNIDEPSSNPDTGGKRARQVLSKSIEESLAATTFPELTTPISELGTESWVEKIRNQGCADVGPENVKDCMTGPQKATKIAAVLGDSFAIAWLPGIREALEPRGYKVQALTRGQCPAADVAVTKDGGESFEQCDDHRNWAIEYIDGLNPDLVILADSDNTLSRLESEAGETSGAAEYREGLEVTISQLRESSRKLAVLSPPPEGASLQECITTFGQPSDCITTISSRWASFQSAVMTAVEATGISYIETRSWFCGDAGRCPGFIESIPVRTDTSHLTMDYSRRLAPLLGPALTK